MRLGLLSRVNLENDELRCYYRVPRRMEGWISGDFTAFHDVTVFKSAVFFALD